MKVVTANRLDDGAVVYLRADDQWTHLLPEAARFADEDADAALVAARARVTAIVDAWLIEIDEEGAPAGRERYKETIRKLGPTVRTDLGYQAEA